MVTPRDLVNLVRPEVRQEEPAEAEQVDTANPDDYGVK